MYEPGDEFGDQGGETLDTAIAIVGMSCRFAGARSIGRYWANLRGGVESVTPFSQDDLIAAGVDPALLRQPGYVRAGAPLDDMECFDAALFGLSPRDAAIMDPQHRHFLECAWEALEDAGHLPERFGGAIGVFGGSGHNSYMPMHLLSNPALVRDVGLFLLRHTGNDKDFLTTRASYLLNLRGPSVNVQTACSTSLVAVHMAIQSLLNGECDMALAGGVSIELPHRRGYLYEEGEILSPDGHCRPFDAASQGTVFGSGVGIVVLRRLVDALSDRDHIHAVIRGSAVNNDGSGKVGYLAPSVDGQAGVIAEALSIAGVDAATIGYVEAHGTGTPVGDPIEIAALSQAYRHYTARTGFCAIGSVKANIGHTDTAAGTASLIKVALALSHRELPPSINYAAPNPACDFDDSPFTVNAALKPWPAPAGHPRRAGVSSLGVGGTNAHVVVEEAPAPVRVGSKRSHHLIAMSARSATALDAGADALAAHLDDMRPDDDLGDAAYTLNIGRHALGQRRIVVAQNAADAALALRDPDRVFSAQAMPGRAVAFMFCGAGSQYVGMGRDLYAAQPVFRTAIDECLAHIDAIGEPGLRRWLFATPDDAEAARRALERPSLALPALFAVQVAMARLWMSWGVRPAGMIGHSSGEYAAAHLAGVITLKDALHVVHTRGRLFETLPEGGMLSVPLPEAELAPLLPPGVSIAAINGPALCVASGGVDGIAALQASLAQREIESQRVRIAVAAHSPMLDPILAEFRACIAAVTLHAPTLPFVSNLTGAWITPEQATDPDYWVRHLRQTVRFTDGMAQLAQDDDVALLEVGPGRTMASLARQQAGRGGDRPVLHSLRHAGESTPDAVGVLATLGRLWASGVNVDWDAFWSGEPRRRVPLPTYQFDRTRHWIEPGRSLATADDTPDASELRPDIADWFFEPLWRREPIASSAPFDGHALIFADRDGLGDAIATRLRAAGRRVTLVRAGRRFARRDGDHFTVDPRRADDYRALCTALASDRAGLPVEIHHCWLASAELSDPAAIQDHGFHALLHLLQALGDHDIEHRVAIAILSTGMQRVCGERLTHPAKATALGLARVVAREYPHIAVRSVDVPPATTIVDRLRTADLAIAELTADDSEEAVAYRAGERWVQRFEQSPRTASAPGSLPPLRHGTVCLITGGLGGLGLALARHLADTRSARLALVARTALPPRAAWADELARRAPGDPVGRTIRKLMAIESAGGEVLVLHADVRDARSVRLAVAQARRRFGRIDAVFHTAGVLDDAIIQGRSRAAADAVLAPKLYGTLALGDALRSDPPDVMMLFSSVSAVAGLAGQADYAAANAFMDAYAQSRHGDPRTHIVSVGWSAWREIGMAAKLAGPSAGAGPEPIDDGTPADHPFLDAVHHISPDEVVVTGALSTEAHWLLDEHRLADGGALVPGTGFLELARAAFAHLHDGPLMLGDVAFLAPFAVPPGTVRALRIHLNRRDDGLWRFAIHGRADDEDWTEHAQGLVGGDRAERPRAAPLDAVRASCTLAADPQDVVGSPYLRFGRRWHNIISISRGSDQALLSLELPEAFSGDLSRIALHPALLDFAVAGGQALIPGHDGTRDFFAPLSYGRIRILAPLPARIVSHIRYRRDQGDGQALAVFDATIADPGGNILVEIEGFTMIRVRDPALLSARITTPAVAGDPRRDAPDLSAALMPDEGLRVIEHILAASPRPHLIVSRQDLAPAIARMRAPRLSPRIAEASDASDEAAPRTDAERMIATIWADMLGIERVGRNDDFFDLGGHSLLAVQFTNRMRKQSGKSIPLSALLDAPTVARLAALVDPQGSAATNLPVAANDQCPPGGAISGVVTIRAGSGDRPALFLVHDGLGETLLYRNLAMRLADGCAVHGLEPGVHPGGGFLHTGITEMASAYVDRIRAVQPHGPYLLAGLCAGGVIAFEMARQLEDAGAAVAFVGILDAADVDATQRRFHIFHARMARVRAMLGGSGPTLAALPMLARKAYNAALWEITSRIEWMRRTRAVDHMRERGQGANGASLDFLHLYEVAHRAHRPKGLFAGGDVVLFRATAGNGAVDDIPYAEIYSDHILGWGKRVADDVKLVIVPGGHTSLLQEPNVAVLARAFQAALDSALARHIDSASPPAVADRLVPHHADSRQLAVALPR